VLLLLGSLLLGAAPQLPRLEGRVVDATGAPAGEALVCLACQGEFLEPQTQLVARANCNGAGEFSIEVPRSWIERQGYKPLTLYAWKPGNGIGAAVYPMEELPLGQRIALALAPPAHAALELVDADGKPVAGARVEPSWFQLGSEMHGAPPEFCAELAARSDANGRVVLDAAPLERILELRITEPAGGTQILNDSMSHPPEWAAGRVQLRARARVRVRGEPRGSSQLTVTTYVTPPGSGSVRRGITAQLESSGALDAPGGLVLDALAPSYTNLSIACAPGATQRPVLTPVKTEPGKESEILLEWRKGLHVSGRVVARGTHEPVAGAHLRWVQYPVHFVDLVSDSDGRFAVEAVHGNAWVASVLAPAPWIPILDPGALRWDLPKDVENFELPEIELVHGVAIHGEVHDARGEPVPFAWVSAEAKNTASRRGESRWLTALADEIGRFSFESVEEGVAIPIRARAGTAATDEPLLFEAHPGLPAVVTIGAAARAALRGRVLDERGAPVAGAEVEVWRAGRENYVGDEKRVGALPLRTDAEGRFESARELDPAIACNVRVRAPGHEQVQGPWRKPAEDAPLELTLPKLARIEGRVLDEYGKPVANAPLRVSDAPAKVEARTDAEGRFVLENVFARPVFVLLELPGGAPRGTLVDARGGRLEWSLGAPEIAGSPAAGATAPAVSREREYEIAESLDGPRLRAAIEAKKPDDIFRALESLAWTDPAGALAHCEEGLIDSYRADIVRNNVAQSLGSSAPEDAALVLGLEQGSFGRAYGLVRLADSLPPERRALALDLLGEALAALGDAGAPEYELVGLASVARTLLALGERDLAQRIVARAAPLVDKLPPEEWTGYARTVYAEVLASFDLEQALAIVAQAKDKSEQQRHYGNIAQRIAGSNPEGAERALALAGKVEAWMEPTRWIPRVCYGMAGSDLARARRIALQGGKAPNGYALGMMALALAGQDRKTALGLLDEAYATLAAQSASGRDRSCQEEECVQAAGLLPVVEKLAPERLSEFVWRALALRRARSSGPDLWHDSAPLLADSALALLLARYDRALARTLLEPAVGQLKLQSSGLGRDWSSDVLPAALAVTDPEWALELSKSVLSERARWTIASVLGRSGEERWRFVMDKYLQLWTVGKEDL
jgi:protocatechuate 3,4-dioxygenase beta subunit